MALHGPGARPDAMGGGELLHDVEKGLGEEGLAPVARDDAPIQGHPVERRRDRRSRDARGSRFLPEFGQPAAETDCVLTLRRRRERDPRRDNTGQCRSCRQLA